jgi:hypothetical protein
VLKKRLQAATWDHTQAIKRLAQLADLEGAMTKAQTVRGRGMQMDG